MFLQSRRECRTQWSQRSRPVVVVVLKWLTSKIVESWKIGHAEERVQILNRNNSF